MKKNRDYKWPTNIIIVLFSSILSLIVFVIIIGVITLNLGKEIEKEQQKRFDETAERIREIIENGDEYSLLNAFVTNGYQIIISEKNGNVSYPYNYTQISNVGTNVILLPMKGMFTDFQVNELFVHISYPIQLTAPDISTIILKSIPYVLLLVVGSITVMIIFYLSLFKKERTKLNILFDKTRREVSDTEIVNTTLNMRLKEYAEIETQVKGLYSQLKLSQNKLEKEVQLVKKLEINNSALLKGMTHEMKTPLMSTKLLVGQLESHNLPDSVQDIIAEINNQTNNLDQLIREILFISQKDSYTHESKQSVIEIIEKVLDNYEVLLMDKQLTIKCEFREDFYMVLNEKIIEKVYSNLVSNAINYAVKKSDLLIKITKQGVVISNEINKDNTIDFHMLGKPFTTFSDFSGTGLGIYLIHTMLINSPYSLSFSLKNENIFEAKIERLEAEQVHRSI